ncbi:DUF3574 domain-containing protein [Streptomyces shenzhenensis]|uniref:Choline dehydrogenase n=1 Tax=Streptomyces shenzhenensis TaxID=943815 RepID=A0A3M0I6P7_9ACTN|nr:DUF3574 domain-containing protein [Streptomyces shenzhenensis]RMB85231.1 choline dehydrogenase [Streptomyces shenzhenensis]
MKIHTRAGLLLGCGLAVTGAALAPVVVAADAPAASRDAYVESTLYFGTERPGGGTPVTEAQFQRFLDTQVTPRFPDGLTVDTVRGQYRDRFGAIEKERSYQVIVLYPAGGAPAADAKLESIRRRYEKTFQQESVGRVDEAVRASF